MSDKNIPLNFHFKRWLGIHLEPESLYCLADAKIYNPFHFIEVFWWPIGDLREHLPRVSYKKPNKSILSGRSSGVERNLAKVEVEGSNPFARSYSLNKLLNFYPSMKKIFYLAGLTLKILFAADTFAWR